MARIGMSHPALTLVLSLSLVLTISLTITIPPSVAFALTLTFCAKGRVVLVRWVNP